MKIRIKVILSGLFLTTIVLANSGFSFAQEKAPYQKELEYKSLFYQKLYQSKNLQKSITLLTKEIEETKEIIKQTEAQLRDVEKQIKEKTIEIDKLTNEIAVQEKILGVVVENLYILYSSNENVLVQLLFGSKNILDFWNAVIYLQNLQAEIQDKIQNIRSLETALVNEKMELEKKQQEYMILKSTYELQKKELIYRRKTKQMLLAKTNKEIKKIAAQLFNLRFNLGEEGISLTEAIQVANFAAKETGVRAALILAIIDQESGLGLNVGTGSYPDDVHPEHREAFLKICQELGLVPEMVRVSRRPYSYPGWGGALGPAQIMPNYWLFLEPQIAEITGHNPPSPWDIKDAFVGAALILKRNGADAKTYDAEYRAAGIYFAGGNWEEYKFYPENVMIKAEIYQSILDNLKAEKKKNPK